MTARAQGSGIRHAVGGGAQLGPACGCLKFFYTERQRTAHALFLRM